MTAPLIPGTSRVVHANRAKSYGVGTFVSPAGPDRATVRFNGERADRTVRVADLSPERALPLAVRHPQPRAILPRRPR